jgi:hypothetical protein
MVMDELGLNRKNYAFNASVNFSVNTVSVCLSREIGF